MPGFSRFAYDGLMKILVTGGAGFIGSNFVEKLLAEGHAVSVLDDFNDFYDPAIKRANTAAFAAHAPVHTADLRDWAAVDRIVGTEKPDTIVHLAARAGVRPSIKEPKLYIDTNITGTWHILEAARLHGVPRVVSASSSSVYGVIKTAPFREDMLINQTISPYAATKMATEQFCSNYTHLYGLRTITLRFFTVYGPRQRPDLAIHSFTRAIDEGRPIQQFGDGSTRRDYTYIDDILQGMSACLTYDGPLCDVFNLGESQTTTLSELISTIEQGAREKSRHQKMPEQPGDVPLTYADISKARRFSATTHTPRSRKAIPKFVEWYRTARRG